jgi:hypothetical protein
MDACIDRYLWRSTSARPRKDSIKVEEPPRRHRQAQGKMVAVMRSFTKLVDEDFGWKIRRRRARAACR